MSTNIWPTFSIYLIFEQISTFLFVLILSHLTYTSSWNVHHMLFFSQFKYYCNSCFLSDKLNIYLFFSWFVAFSVSVLPVLVPPMCISMHSNYPSLYEKVTCIVTPTFPFPGRTVIIWKYSNIPLLTIISRTASGIYQNIIVHIQHFFSIFGLPTFRLQEYCVFKNFKKTALLFCVK